MEHGMEGLALAVTALVVLASSAPWVVAQWDDCRFGEVNCTGGCGAFIDSNGDGICDSSQPQPPDGQALQETDSGIVTLQEGPQDSPGSQLPFQQEKAYHLLEITALVSLAYAATYMLARKGRISVVSHRKIWNVLLLATFVVMGALSILLVIRIDYGWSALPHFVMLNLHVETGIAMTVISIFHVLWHWRYYACMLRTGNSMKGAKGGKKCES